jgi:hypothetical protein
MDSKKISLDPSAIAWRLAMVAMLFVAIDMAMQAFRILAHQEHVFGLAMMSLDGEFNLPSLFSTVLLLCASLLLTLIALIENNDRTPDTSKWVILAMGFLAMGVDETLSIHERLIAPMRNLLGGHHLGIFYFAWVVPGVALVVALGAFFLPFLFRLPRKAAIAFVISAAVYLGGALGVEIIEGWWREGHGHRNLIYQALVGLEEGMEMIGVILFIHALLDYIASHYKEVRFGFNGAAATVPEAIEPVPGMQRGQAGPFGAPAPTATLLRD